MITFKTEKQKLIILATVIKYIYILINFVTYKMKFYLV